MSKPSTGLIEENVASEATSTRRTLPPVSQSLRPAYFLRFVEFWFFSRNASILLLGLPSALVLIAGILLLIYLKNDNQNRAILLYQAEFSKAVAAENWDEALLYQSALSSLRPSNPEFRWALATLYYELGNRLIASDSGSQKGQALLARAVGLMQPLVPLGDKQRGYPKARLWLVQHDKNLGVKLSAADRKKQLEKAARESVKYNDPSLIVPANQLLAKIYIAEANWEAAAACYETSARYYPDDYLALARLQQEKLNQGPTAVQNTLEKVRAESQNRVARSSVDIAARLQWAESYIIQNRYNEAEGVLLEGLKDNPDNVKLAEARARLRIKYAMELNQQDGENQYAASLKLIEALEVYPGSTDAVRQLASVPQQIVAITPERIQNALKFWKQQTIDRPDEVLPVEMYGQLLESCGEYAAAIEVLEPIAHKHNQLTRLLARNYLKNGQRAQASPLYDKLIKKARFIEDVKTDRQIYLTALLQWEAERFEQAINSLQTAYGELTDEEKTAVGNTLGRFKLAQAHRFMVMDEDRSPEAMQLCLDAMDSMNDHTGAIYKLAAISCSEKSAAMDADQQLTRLLAEGPYNWDVFYTLGEQALRAEQYAKARRNLERALDMNRADKRAKIQILNNLALAISRGPDPDYSHCLKLINEVMDLLPDAKHPDAYSTRAEIYVGLGRFQEADRDLQKALPERPRSMTVHKLLITVNENLGEEALANEHRRIVDELKTASESDGAE